jgi:hypothetical protein
MKFQYTFILFLLLLAAQSAVAQSKKENSKEPETNGQPSSLTPNYSEKARTTEKTKRKRSTRKVTYDARDKFYDRMEQVSKDNRKAEKEMQKPQYSDPSYFGHKRPPKRRPAGKLKYCKECGLRH